MCCPPTTIRCLYNGKRMFSTMLHHTIRTFRSAFVKFVALQNGVTLRKSNGSHRCVLIIGHQLLSTARRSRRANTPSPATQSFCFRAYKKVPFLTNIQKSLSATNSIYTNCKHFFTSELFNYYNDTSHFLKRKSKYIYLEIET